MSKHLERLHMHKKLVGAHNVNVNTVHKDTMTFNDRIAKRVSGFVGTMYFCYGLASLMFLWALSQQFLFPDAHITPFDPYPFAFLFFILGGIMQSILMPLIMTAQNLDARHQELRAELDLHINQASFSKLEEHSRVLEEQNTDLLKHSNQLGMIGTATNEVRIMQMQQESMLVSLSGSIDRLTQLVEATDRRLQQLQKKASGA